MKYIKFEYEMLDNFDINTIKSSATQAFSDLNEKEENKMTGWVDVENIISKQEIDEIINISKEIQNKAQVLLVVGIGGSYLGAKAGIDYLSDYYNNNKVEVIFVGNSISEKYLEDTIKYIKNKDFYINVISKSGTTLEPAIAFRILKKLCEEKYKQEAKDRIIVTTSKNTGLLKDISKKHSYRTFYIPDNVGGRYSVLTPVGLLPLAVAGFDINKILNSAIETKKEIFNDDIKNPAIEYAAIRNHLYKTGKDIEVYSTFHPNMRFFLEWMKQLFGESECKNNTGIFPASLVLTSDLHSMGQLMQDGKRNLFETFINVDKEKVDGLISFEEEVEDEDKLNYLKNITMNEINNVAKEGTMKAHKDGLVPIIKISVEKQTEETLGALFYFFEFSCAISAYMLHVNPFNQPGVENYKSNIKQILNK